MSSGQRFLTTFILWAFAMALPLRPVIIVLHNTFAHSTGHKVAGQSIVGKGNALVPLLSKHFRHFKKVDKRTFRPSFISPPPSCSFFQEAPSPSWASLPKDLTPPSDHEVIPLRI